MITIIDDDEPVCQNCAYYDCRNKDGSFCVNNKSPHFSEIMNRYEGCAWICPERKAES